MSLRRRGRLEPLGRRSGRDRTRPGDIHEPRLRRGGRHAGRTGSTTHTHRTGRRHRRRVPISVGRHPSLVILTVLSLAGVSYTRTTHVIVLLVVLSLWFWCAVAGRRAGLTGWSLWPQPWSAWPWAVSSLRFKRCSSPVMTR